MAKMHDGPIREDLFDGTLNGYQEAAQQTAIYPGKGSFNGLIYATLKGCGEAGEQAEKVGKIMRDHDSVMTPEHIAALALELGDELWYIAAKANELGYSLNDIANLNIQKLKSRQQRGTLSGSGDNR